MIGTTKQVEFSGSPPLTCPIPFTILNRHIGSKSLKAPLEVQKIKIWTLKHYDRKNSRTTLLSEDNPLCIISKSKSECSLPSIHSLHSLHIQLFYRMFFKFWEKNTFPLRLPLSNSARQPLRPPPRPSLSLSHRKWKAEGWFFSNSNFMSFGLLCNGDFHMWAIRHQKEKFFPVEMHQETWPKIAWVYSCVCEQVYSVAFSRCCVPLFFSQS